MRNRVDSLLKILNRAKQDLGMFFSTAVIRDAKETTHINSELSLQPARRRLRLAVPSKRLPESKEQMFFIRP
jgi:hypothetical protein